MLLKCCNLLKCLTVIKWLKKEEEQTGKHEGRITFSSNYFSSFFSYFSSLINWRKKRILWKPRRGCWGASGGGRARSWEAFMGPTQPNAAHQSWPATVHPGALSKPWHRGKHSSPWQKQRLQTQTAGSDGTRNTALHSRRNTLQRVQMSG